MSGLIAARILGTHNAVLPGLHLGGTLNALLLGDVHEAYGVIVRQSHYS